MPLCRTAIRILALAGLALIAWRSAAVAHADVLELKNGGRIHGELQSGDDEGSDYVIATSDGGRITVKRSEVSRAVKQTDDEEEYHRLTTKMPDTVDAHWKLAQWCRERKLIDEYHEQLEQILKLDPDHADARSGLGYQRKNGEWMLREDIMAARGLVLYKGNYCTPQHVELLKQAEQERVADADWNNRLGLWRRWLTGRRPDRSQEALHDIQAIHAPEAAPAVVDLLRREQQPDVKRLLLEVTAQIDDPVAVDALVELSLKDPDPETRHQCLEYLIDAGHVGLSRPYIRALKSQDNAIVNRAAMALQMIGDRDAIGPLINALVTKHKQIVGSGSPDQHSYVFTPSGGTAMNFGGSGAKVVNAPVENRSVLTALVTLSGNANFGYDEGQWRAWLAAQAKAHPIDIRRD
jgi:HEAT repeats